MVTMVTGEPPYTPGALGRLTAPTPTSRHWRPSAFARWPGEASQDRTTEIAAIVIGDCQKMFSPTS